MHGVIFLPSSPTSEDLTPSPLTQIPGQTHRLCKRQAGLMAPAELLAYAEGWPGQCRSEAIRAARLVRARTDSVPETKLRLLMVLAGMNEPVVNHPVIVDGEERYFLDLAYPELMTAIEYDGKWHDQPEQRAKDERRREELRDLGWTVIVLRSEDLFETPGLTLECLAATVVAAGAGPVRLRDTWRAHFQVDVTASLTG